MSSPQILIHIPRRSADSLAPARVQVIRRATTALPSGLSVMRTSRVKGAEYPISRLDRFLFLLGLLVLIGTSVMCIYASVQERQIRFSLTEMKKTEALLIKEKEHLTEQARQFMNHETILRQATEQGMIQAPVKQIMTLD